MKPVWIIGKYLGFFFFKSDYSRIGYLLGVRSRNKQSIPFQDLNSSTLILIESIHIIILILLFTTSVQWYKLTNF